MTGSKNSTGTASHPKISIVVPSYNQQQYLGHALESLLSQGYPRLEVIVMDGGSSDGSVGIIESYAGLLTYWQSKPDAGQAAAIAGGFAKASGELLMWINSDDVLLPNSLFRHAAAYQRHPKAGVFYGDHIVIDEFGRTVEKYRHPRFYCHLAWRTAPYIAQPGTSFTRAAWNRVNGIDARMQCAFDYDLWYRFMDAGLPFVHVGGYVAGFRLHEAAKSQRAVEIYRREYDILKARYGGRQGTKLEQYLARGALMAMQIANGAYLETVGFRLLSQHRFRAYSPKGKSTG